VPTATPATATPRVVSQNRFWIGAAAALLVLLIGSNAYWATVTSEIRQSQAAFIDQLDQQNVLIAGLTSGNVMQVALNPSEGNARVFWSTQEQVAMLATEGLPTLSQDQTYQLWLITGDTPISAGTFIVDDTGRAILFFDPAQNMSEYDAVGISTEPAGGSEAPTTTPIAVGEI
jgi:anti-sigma-K factor RskA